MRRRLLALVFAPALAAAQSAPPTEFPSAAQAVEPAALQAALTSKVLRVQPAQGAAWRLEFKTSGYAFLNVGTGFSDTGRWSVEGSQLCMQWQRAASGCSEARLLDSSVYIRRTSNGEVVALVPD